MKEGEDNTFKRRGRLEQHDERDQRKLDGEIRAEDVGRVHD